MKSKLLKCCTIIVTCVTKVYHWDVLKKHTTVLHVHAEMFIHYEPMQALSSQSTPRNEHYQDVGLHTEYEQYQNEHLQNEYSTLT